MTPSAPAAKGAWDRQRAITAELVQIPLRDVMESHFGFEGRRSGGAMVKYEVAPGIHLNCSTADSWFGTFNGLPVPGLGDGRATGGHGAIDAVIAVRSILGQACDFRSAKRELQEAFLPGTLAESYQPSPPLALRRRSVPAGDRPAACVLPARFDRSEDYLRAGAGAADSVLKLPDDIAGHIASYLCDTRNLPRPLVEDLMRRNAAYPSVRERALVSRRTLRPYQLAEPMVVFPLTAWSDATVVGYDYKTLPLDPAFAPFAASEGRKKMGGYQVGTWDQRTRQVILTEGALDGLSKWVLERPADDTCIWAMSGARVSESLLRHCQERRIEVRAAFDNDSAGRMAAAATKRACDESGVACGIEFVRPSEIDFDFQADAAGEARALALSDTCRERRLPFRLEPVSSGRIHGVMGNEDATMTHLDRFIREDHLTRMAAATSGRIAADTPRVRYGVRNKDWNDVLRGGFEPRLQHGIAVACAGLRAIDPSP